MDFRVLERDRYWVARGYLCSCGALGIFLNRGRKSIVLTWDLKLALSLEELSVC